MKTKLLILFLLLLAPANNLLVQEIPDCWCMPRYYPPNEEYFNEHFYYDTCDAKYITTNCDSAYWLNINRTFDGLNRIYAKFYWDLWFDVMAFPLPFYPPDTVIEVSWMDVDSVNYPEIKDSLKMIENIYGQYKMIKNHPDIIQPGIGQRFTIYFDNYVNGVELENKFNAIPFANCSFSSGNWHSTHVHDFNEGYNKEINISPNPASEYIEINVGVRYAVPARNEQIQIFDIYGKQMPVGAHCPDIIGMPLRIDVSQFPVGIYFVRYGNAIKSFVRM